MSDPAHRTGHRYEGNVASGHARVQFGDHYGDTYHNHAAPPSNLDQQCLRDLFQRDPRDDRSRILLNKDKLQEELCSWILGDAAFTDWYHHDDTRFLWIRGDPGKGKTMMMLAIISEIERRIKTDGESDLLVFFFCQKTDNELNTTLSVLRGLIYMLIRQEGTLMRHLHKKYGDTGPRLFEGPTALYALLQVLSDILQDSSASRVYVMIDALDECDEDIRQLLNWIGRQNSGSISKVKWLVTSRNEIDIQESLEEGGLRLNTSLELNSAYVDQAVNHFIDTRVDGLAALKHYDGELRLFVTDKLREKSGGTFLWVALVCRELQDARRWETRDILEKMPPGLESLYKLMLERIQRGKYADLCVRVLCSVTYALRPLHSEELVVYAKLQEAFFCDATFLPDLVSRCGSFLTIRQDVVYFVHQSAKDYLSTGKGSNIFQSDSASEHGQFAALCFSFMSISLKRNICSMESFGALAKDIPGSVLADRIPSHVQYACLYWGDHLILSLLNGQEPHDVSQVVEFFSKHFLYWLEATSLMGKIPEAVQTIIKLQSSVLSERNNNLGSILHDALRFILQFRAIIERAPLQLYASALVFSPKRSIIREQYMNEFPHWVRIPPVVEDSWNSCLQTLEGHTQGVQAVAFSPDGRRLASASLDHTVRLWDASTGAACGTLDGHTHMVHAVAFSPDGRRLASASLDHTVRLWDASTGAACGTLEGHTDSVQAVAFSPDGRRLASASLDHTVRLWDASTGAACGTLEGHTQGVYAVAFSPDGRRLASASEDRTVRLWDASTGAACGTLEGHTDTVYAVAFSPDGRRLASASEDETVRLWDASTGAACGTLEGHTDSVYAVAFSPDGRRLASASEDRTVRLWDASTGAACGTLEGHTDSVHAVAFSPDGRRLASASWDQTVRLWDASTGAACGTLEGHTHMVHAVAFSPDGRRLASASWDHTVRLWDASTGAACGTLEGHTDMVNAVAFSPDGRRLASASWDRTVRLWDASTGAACGTLEGHTDRVNAVAFSPDGRRLASASWDHTVRLWDFITGVLEKRFNIAHVSNLSFSDDGSFIYTDRGGLPVFPTARHFQPPSSRSSLWMLQDDWLLWNSQNTLWIPPEFGPVCSAFHGDLLSMGCGSGRVVFIGLEANMDQHIK